MKQWIFGYLFFIITLSIGSIYAHVDEHPTTRNFQFVAHHENTTMKTSGRGSLKFKVLYT